MVEQLGKLFYGPKLVGHSNLMNLRRNLAGLTEPRLLIDFARRCQSVRLAALRSRPVLRNEASQRLPAEVLPRREPEAQAAHHRGQIRGPSPSQDLVSHR
jgi:hypothetical protein